MTTPDLSSIIPLKWKTWVGLVGAVLTFVVPLILSVEDYLPSPWPAVIGGALSVLTALGIYKAPYVPPGAVVVPEPAASTHVVIKGAVGPAGPTGAYTNPWA